MANKKKPKTTRLAKQVKPQSATPQYRLAVVTFLDILGFGDLVKKGPAENVAKVLATVSRFAGAERGEADDLAVHSIEFSDSVVRVQYLDGKNAKRPVGQVWSELYYLSLIQGELINHDVILRGGVTVGEIYLNNGTVFGPAMVQAYSLESKSAIYPRVVIDPAILNRIRIDPLLRNRDDTVEESIASVRKLIARGQDGFWYVDYLRSTLHSMDRPIEWPNLLANHRKLVMSRYGDQRAKTGFLDKLLWLALYQNRVVASIDDKHFTDRGLRRRDFEIRTRDIPELARMPKLKR